jgi:hypothetical protein
MTNKPRAHICRAPDCNTLVLGEPYCFRHRWMTAQAGWAISAFARDDQQDEPDQQDHDQERG